MMGSMPVSDRFFLINESRTTPMHVGGLCLYRLPDDVDEVAYLDDLLGDLRQEVPLRPAFGDILKMTPLGQYGPIRLTPDTEIDMEYHVRHAALPQPGRYRELFELVSRMHGLLLDRTRPLWEFTLISGLPDRQFATFFKIHHALMDGASAIHFMRSMLSTNKAKPSELSPFSLEAYEVYKSKLPQRPKPKGFDLGDFAAVRKFLTTQWGDAVAVAKALASYQAAWFGMGKGLEVPWREVPRTSINRRITGSRRFVAQSWPLERVRAVGKAYDGTINDAVLAMCAGALRRYLLEHRELPDKPLKAMAPVSIRAKDDTDSGNAVGFITANLATNVSDPGERIKVIQQSMQSAKQQLRAMTAPQIKLYSMITQAPMLLVSLAGAGSLFPAFSVVISNVPGPEKQMFWNGAALEGIYPANVPFDGFAMSITQISNHDRLDFGIAACRRTVPHMQRMIDYLEEALVELEAKAGIKAG